MLSDAEIETFRLVADKLALQDLVMRYSRAVDRGDFVMLRDCYHPDATADHGDLYKGPVEQYIQWLEAALSHGATMSHYVVNTLFEVRGDHAEGEVYKINYHRTPAPDSVETISGARSHDTFARRDGVWRFSSRAVALDWMHIHPTPMAAYDSPSAGSPRGTPGVDDLSYARLPLFARGGPKAWR